MDTNTLIVVLAIGTLLAAVGIGFWQKARTSKAEKINEHSAVSEKRPELKANPRGTDPEAVRPLAQRVEENR